MENLTINAKKDFTSGHFMATFYHVLAKSNTSREKLNFLLLANNSTPKNNRAFFVRSLRTPKKHALKNSVLSSMVGRNGQYVNIGCFPVTAVSHPVTPYRPTVRKLAVDSITMLLESITMIFLFKALSRRDLSNTRKTVAQMPVYTLKTEAESEEQARAKFAPFYCILETLAATASNKGAFYA